MIAVIVRIFQMTGRSNLAPDYVKFVDFVQSANIVIGILSRARTLLMRAFGISLHDKHKNNVRSIHSSRILKKSLCLYGWFRNCHV